MEYLVLSKPDKDLLKQAVLLHIKSLSYRSFITNFGERFLYEIYKAILVKKMGIIVLAKENNILHGFVLGCFNSSLLTKIIIYRFYTLLPVIIYKTILKPKILKKIFETLFYEKKENSNIRAELIIIAVNPEKRSKNIGSNIINKLNDVFEKNGISKYKVTVHNDMLRSNNFYLKNNFFFDKSFLMYNVKWNLYVKTI